MGEQDVYKYEPRAVRKVEASRIQNRKHQHLTSTYHQIFAQLQTLDHYVSREYDHSLLRRHSQPTQDLHCT